MLSDFRGTLAYESENAPHRPPTTEYITEQLADKGRTRYKGEKRGHKCKISKQHLIVGINNTCILRT